MKRRVLASAGAPPPLAFPTNLRVPLPYQLTRGGAAGYAVVVLEPAEWAAAGGGAERAELLQRKLAPWL
jgi:hypothetical protein